MSNSPTSSYSSTSASYRGINPNAPPYFNNKVNKDTMTNTIPSSRRTDGSYREEIKVRSGYCSELEKSKSVYIPPPARSNSNSNSSGSSFYAQNSSSLYRTSNENTEDRVDSWADENESACNSSEAASAAVVDKIKSPKSETESIETPMNEVAHEIKPEIKIKTNTYSVNIQTQTPESELELLNVSENTTNEVIVREPPKPSQLATAIDTAIDATILNSGESSVSGIATSSITGRPMGRFATQIANEEKYQYRRYDNYGSNYQSGASFYNNRDSTVDNDNNTRDFRDNSRLPSNNTWNRCTNFTETATPVINKSTKTHNTNENRIETEFKTFLEELTGLRREMAVINAKLEYIRYMKARDCRELSEIEKERLKSEPVLINRIDTIFELIDAALLSK